MRVFPIVVALAIAVAALSAQDPPPPPVDPIHKPFDEILDIYVRDGLVYYNALQNRAGEVRSLRGRGLRGAGGGRQRLARATASWRTGSTPITPRAANRDRSLSDPRQGGRLSRQQHSTGAGRVRAADLPRRRPHVHARRPRARRDRRVRRRPGVAGAQPRRAGRAAPQERGLHPARLDAQLETMAGELVDHRQLVRVDAANNTLSCQPDVFVARGRRS